MLHPAMNNTKWNEVRSEMLKLQLPPAWTTVAINGFRSQPDRDWHYHLKAGGYEDILELHILVENATRREEIRTALKKVHVPGEETPEGFRVFGYLSDGQTADYL